MVADLKQINNGDLVSCQFAEVMIERGAHINFESPLDNLSRRAFLRGGAAGCAGWIAGIAIPYLPKALYASSSTSGDIDIMDNSQHRMEKTIEVIRQGQKEGWHLGAQVYVSIEGEPVADIAIGQAHPERPLDTDALMTWMSAVKPIGAVAIAQLWEKDRVALDDRVVDYIPEFGRQGKEIIKIRHLLTHTSGLENAKIEASTWDELIAGICQVGRYDDWIPGEKAGYNVGLAWCILAEIVRRIDGRPYDKYAREEILIPLGMKDSWIRLTSKQEATYGDRLAPLYQMEDGKPQPLPWEKSPEGIYYPGGSGRGPIRELAYFYEMLMGGGEREGIRVLSPQSVETLTRRHRTGLLDQTFGKMDWGLRFMLDSHFYNQGHYNYDFGAYSSPHAFGHAGYQCSTGFSDPLHGLAVAWAVNGLAGDEAHTKRNHAINSAIYEDLGLQ